MRRLLAYPAGRRSKWVVLAVMLLLAAAAGSQSSKLEGAQENDPSSFLPGESESVEALEAAERFPSGELTPAIAVFRRDRGLTAPDRLRITEATNALGQLAERHPRQVGEIPPPQLSRDDSAVLVVVPLKPDGESDVLLERTDDIREIVAGVAGAGLEAKVTGPAGYSADAIEVFSSIDSTLLISTAGLVFVLLIVIYRSPIFWIIPLFAVGMAESSARGLGYLMTELGVTINGQSAGVLVVLVFGAGTDYALLLVARYREELRKHEDKHDAMRIALGRAGPTILASGLTTVTALLCLSLADLNATAGLGPVGAAGIALAVAFMLSLLPVLLLVAGRRAFWPYVPRYGSEGADELHGFWRRVGDRIQVRPRRVWVGTLGVLAVMALGLVSLNDDLTTGNGFRGEVESVDGQALLAKSFPAGSTAPTFVVVRDPWPPARAQRAVRGVDGVASVGPVERGEPGGRFEVTLEPAPYSAEAFAVIPRVRQALDHALRGPSDRTSPALVGGPTAEEYDLRVASARDNRLIIPLILVVVFLILTFVLRAVYTAVLLIGTVIASYLAALGFASVLFENILDYPGIDPTLPLFAFTFLIALGVDYNIFLMARVREEARTHGTAEGTLRGLAVTGGVITSAGIVLAGTFSFLAILPLYALTEIGVTIVFGVLLDTFIVRSILVPALALDIGDRIWWPRPLR